MMKTMVFLKKVCFVAITLVYVSAIAAADFPDTVQAAKGQIKGQSIVASIDFLASKYCRGRETGDKGIDLAAKFLTTLLSAAGLTPAGDMGSFFQSVPLRRVKLGEPLYLKMEEFQAGTKSIGQARLETDFLPIILSGEREVIDVPLVFAGYGITAPEFRYDDYRGVDVKGKVVLLLRHEPKENADSDLFEGRRMSSHATLLAKILNAQKHGAIGVLIVNDPLNHPDALEFLQVRVGGTYWPQLRAERMKDDENFPFMKFSPQVRIAGDDHGVHIPVMGISGAYAAELLGPDASTLDLQKGIDQSMAPRSFVVANRKVSLAVRFAYENLNAYNIVAKIEGSDPKLKEEAVVIGAHYDHMGRDNRGQVYGGADDNASGTAAVVEIARAFKSMATKPKRTLVFVLFCGEEMGLLGSSYYAQNPVMPLDKTAAMINLDMVGRNDIRQLNVLGKYQYPKLFALAEEANRKGANFDFNFTVEDTIQSSDQFAFMRGHVPSLFFITGMHDQYHRPEDTANLIISEKVEKVAQLAFLTLWQAAELPAGSSLK